MHVVDQHDPPAPHRGPAPFDDAKCAGHRFGALTRAHAAQHRRRARSGKHHRIGGQATPPADRACDQRRLVEPARPEPPTMERHRHEQLRPFGQQPHHRPRDRFGESRAAAIFEPQRDAARNLAISDGGPRAVMERRPIEACAAACIGAAIDIERLAARRTPGRPQKTKPAPAFGAEAMIGLGHRAASGATRRERP